MPRGTNRHVILSHGGKHGVGATYLKGRVPPAKAQEAMPPELLTEVSQPGGGDLPADSAKGGGHKVTPGARAQPPARRPEAAVEAPKAQAPTRAPITSPKPVQALPEPQKASDVTPSATSSPDPVKDVAGGTPEGAADRANGDDPDDAEMFDAPDGDDAITIPTSKRQLARMSKADAYALAVELGVDVPANADDIKASDLKTALAREIGL